MKAICHSVRDQGKTASKSGRDSALALRRGIARPCGGLEFFATNASVKRTGDLYCGRPNHKIKNGYLDRFADAIECHGPCR
jgi:hypothetical protein